MQLKITDFASLTENALTNAFSGAEDALVSFVKTGKLDFSGLVDSILADLTRLLARQALLGLISAFGGDGSAWSSLFTAAAGSGHAAGGDVVGGGSYLVGERGPEIFRPATNGNIVPNSQIGGGGGQSTTIINVVSEDMVFAAMASARGSQVVLNHLGKNRDAAKNKLRL